MSIELRVGQDLPSNRKLPDEVVLFTFAAAAWNQHRIHYDRERARAEGHRDLVVDNALRGSWLAELATSLGGMATGRLRRLQYRHIAPAYVNETFTVSGRVLSVQESIEESVISVDCAVWLEGPDGVVTEGTATVEIPT